MEIETAKRIYRGPRKVKDAQEWKVICAEMQPVVNKAKLGKMMRRLREDSGLSLREVARRMEFSAPYISDCEVGNRELNTFELQRFINICNQDGPQ